MKRLVKVAAIQCGPATEQKEENLKSNLELLGQAAEGEPNFIVLSELCMTPYWCMVLDNKYFKWAEPIPGPTTVVLGEKAREYKCYILAPIFEKAQAEGAYFNSVAVIGPDGNIVHGKLPDGTEVHCYRKNNIPMLYKGDRKIYEKYYFKPGSGFPVFKTNIATIGILVCWDRLFPESWRVLALQGAEIVFVPIASRVPLLDDELWLAELRIRAVENNLFVIGCNKGGCEILEGIKIVYLGGSCVIDPFGKVLARGQTKKGQAIISSTIDLARIDEARLARPCFRDRRPEIYNRLVHMH